MFRDKDSIYYVDEEGKMVQDTWIYADAGSVTIDGFEEGWYYFGADGKGYRRKNSSFKRNIGGSIYIFDENGKMLSGWFDEDRNPIEDSDTPFVEGVYYAKEDGRLLTGNGWIMGKSMKESGVPTWTVRLQEETTRIMTRCGFF